MMQKSVAYEENYSDTCNHANMVVSFECSNIVDEYDAPLLHTYETGYHDACREIYRNFFTGLKDYGYLTVSANRYHYSA